MQFALLEPLQLQLIDVHVHGEPVNDIVKIAMRDPQGTQFLDVAEQFAIDVVFVIRHSRSNCADSPPIARYSIRLA